MMHKTIFVTIGYIEERKGQDILIEAVDCMSDEMKNNCSFVIVGQDDTVMGKKLKHKVINSSCVEMKGIVDRIEIHRILDYADVLICPSRRDPMPTVCAEAMMHGVPCLVSDAVGTAEYISHGINGLIFKSEDKNDLKEKITWCIENRNLLKKIGQESRKVYEKVFSDEIFERNLLSYIEEMI